MTPEKLKELVPGIESEALDYQSNGDIAARHKCTREDIKAITQAFKDAGYYLEILTCVDWREPDGVFHIVFQFNTYGKPDRHRVHYEVKPEENAQSIAMIYDSANWHEREVYDMFGVKFDEHPNLTRILTEEGADYHPLLKDFVADNVYSDSRPADA